ncbi:MAG: acyl-CoA dehydrogenase family protein [Pseudomonadota bacterium]
MKFSSSTEVIEALGTFDRLLENRWDPLHNARSTADSSTLPKLWQEMADIGLLALCISENDGGYGQDASALAKTAQTLGARLCHVPYISTIACCVSVISAYGTPRQRAEWLPEITTGKRIWAFAHSFGDAPQVEVVKQHGDMKLHGRVDVVLDAPAADQLLISATYEGNQVLVALPTDSSNLEIHAYGTIDGRVAGDIQISGALTNANNFVGGFDRGSDALAHGIANGCIALAGEAVGLMERLLSLTQDYLRVRVQFGQPLSQFQVLQHQAADMLVALEQTRSITLYAAHLQGSPQAARSASAAKAYAGTAARLAANAAIQLHGAMGMVDETLAAHYAKRLALLGKWLGTSSHHLNLRIATDPEMS